MKKEDFYDQTIIETWGENSSLDGITNSQKFYASSPRILWILKEGNNGDEDPISCNQRDFHNKITEYPNWKATYQKICYINFALLNKYDFYDHIVDIDENAEIEGEYTMDKIAFINVKKNSGDSRANSSEIEENFSLYKKQIIEQIEGIDPEVIFNASGVKSLTLTLKELNKFKVIELYHPNSRTNQEEYVNDAISKYKSL